MKLNVLGKTITITDKNARAYEKMVGAPLDSNDVFVYVAAKHHPTNTEVYIKNASISHLEECVNAGIEQEVRDCCGDDIYERA